MSVRAERVRLPPGDRLSDVLDLVTEVVDADGWRAAAPAPRPPRPGLALALASRQESLASGPRAIANARALDDPATLVVVAGQQPGLLGGALLALHKAAGALRLATRLEQDLGRRVVPVFWSASEDHDLDEMRSTWILDATGQARRFSLDVDARGRSASDVPVDAREVESLVGEIRAALPPTPRARAALEGVPRPGDEDFATWSARCLVHWLGDTGLVIVEPGVVYSFAGDLIARLARRGREIARAVAETGGKWFRDAGREPPIRPELDALPLFVRESRGGPRMRATAARAEEVARLVEREPALGSADVVGRVLLQDALLPVAAFLTGPTEMEYVMQIAPAHEVFEAPMPVVLPRPQATWTDAKSERAAEAFGFGMRDLLAGAAAWTGPSPASVTALEPVSRAIDDALERASREGDRGAVLRRVLERLRSEASKAEDRLREEAAAEAGVGQARWARLQTLLFPGGRPQERVLSPLSIVARHGLDALREGLSLLDPLAPGHVVLHLGDDPQEAS